MRVCVPAPPVSFLLPLPPLVSCRKSPYFTRRGAKYGSLGSGALWAGVPSRVFTRLASLHVPGLSKSGCRSYHFSSASASLVGYRTGEGIQGFGFAAPFFAHPIEQVRPVSEDLRHRL